MPAASPGLRLLGYCPNCNDMVEVSVKPLSGGQPYGKVGVVRDASGRPVQTVAPPPEARHLPSRKR